MRSIVKLMKQLKSDEDGAALVEYTVLLGIMLVAVVGVIVAVGGWVSNKWVDLNTAINAH
jgi:pilus assembly protein Flp/PilA